MSTNGEVIAGAIGAGLGTATIWLPITYFALRKTLQLRNDIGRAWRPYLSCIALFAIIHLLGLESSTATVSGSMVFILVPIIVCTVVLYFTYRAVSNSPLQ